VILLLSLLFIHMTTSTYIVTCHNDNECGSVCNNQFSDDIAAPSEGLFGTSCWCQNHGPKVQRCSYGGVTVMVCADHQPPNCDTACRQNICVYKDGLSATATVLSACPSSHDTNTRQCCDYRNDDYCTCIIRNTLDLNWKPYGQLGGTNGWSSSANWGRCGSSLESLKIDIESERASELVKPFLMTGTMCHKGSLNEPVADVDCEIFGEELCSNTPGCTYCKSKGMVKSMCYHLSEAAPLSHILNSEQGKGYFKCDMPLTIGNYTRFALQ